MTISLIIPTLNEAEQIGLLLQHLNGANHVQEIIVVDGGSTDDTVSIARQYGAKVISSEKGRAVQMNRGAAVANGDILTFLHADTMPPKSFDDMILHAIQNGYDAGSFRLSFDDRHWMIRFTAWLVNKISRLRFGDQSLFLRKEVFQQVGGFDESRIIMEDTDIANRIKQIVRFTVLEQPVTTSARKFHENGRVRLFLIFALIYILYEFDVSQQTLLRIYKSLIRQNKI